MLGLPDQITQDQRNQIDAPTAAERVWQSVKEGWQNAPTILPPDSGQQVTPGSGLGVNQPLVTIGNTILGAGNALLSGAQRFAYESIAPYSKTLARDVAAAPEAFPTGDYGQVTGPRSVVQARNAVERTTPQVPLVPQAVTDAITSPFSATRPITVQEITDAIKRSDINAAEPPPNQMMPGEAPAPSGPAPQATPQTDTTGLAAGVGGMGAAISESLRDHLWSQLQKGDLTEAGAPSTILQAAKAQVDSGAIKTRADFDQFYQNYGDQLRAQRTGTQQPPPQPDATAPPQPTHIYQSADHDFPVTPTGREAPHTDGRVYAEVQPPDGPVTWVPKEQLAEAPQPAPAGAQITPPGQATLTPEQEAAAGSTADKQWYYKTIVPGERNSIQYIDGITPTMAQEEQTVNAARDSKLLRRISPDAEQNERELLADHSTKRKAEFHDIAGSDVTSNTAMKAANDQIEQQLQAAYAHGGSVDLQPVVDAAKAELTGSAGKLPPVKSAMQQIIDAAQKDDGSGLETDPRQANAVRRVIIYLQSKEGRLANPGYGSPDTMAAMTRVKDVLTKQIEPAAPGFTEANANYAKARQALEAREALQEYEPKLYTGPLGNMTFGPMHRLMGDIIKARDPNAPLSGYKALTEEQMNRLKSLHDDLQRVASAEELAKAAGSDTAQTLIDLARRAARHGVGGLVGMGTGFAVGHLFGHEAGMATGMFTKDVVNRMFEQREVNKATAEHARMLRPDGTRYPTVPNPFTQPPGAP